MKVSVIIPTLNEEATIERCLKSISKQTYRDFEVIVVDASKDKTPQIVSQYDVVLLSQKPRGAPAARKYGVEHATGDIIAWVDPDDFLALDYLEKNVRPFFEPNVYGVYVRMEFLKPDATIGKVFYYYRKIFLIKSKYSQWPRLWRRSVFKDLSGDVDLCDDATTGDEIIKKIIYDKERVLKHGEGIYYFADLEDTLIKHLKKSVWYGEFFPGICQRNKKRVLAEGIPIVFFALAPLGFIAYFLTYNIIYLLYVLAYLGTWPYVIVRALRKKLLSKYVILIPPLMTLRAIGLLIGTFTSLTRIILSKVGRIKEK